MAVTVRSLYTSLAKHLEEVSFLGGIRGLLEWDSNVMMPPASAVVRGKQVAALEGVVHDKATAPELGNLLQQLEKSDLSELNEYEKANIRDARRKYNMDTSIPKDLAQRIANFSVEGYTAWVESRKNNDFKTFAPILDNWVNLIREKSQHINPNLTAYEVSLDQFDRGLKVERLDALFSDLKAGLIPLIHKIRAAKAVDRSFLQGLKFDVKVQVELNHKIAQDLGFDTTKGRLDVSVHPFTGGSHPTDVRMTTRYKDDDLVEGITGTIHETGHSLYEQGRNLDRCNLPVGEALSMSIHESQSLLWERMVGLSEEFWDFYWPKVQAHFPQIPSNVSAKQFHRVINEVKAGFIRVEADEITYPLHIILRFELERDLVGGKITVDDLPRLWADKMKEYLGIVPETDTLGVLQDTHWSVGLFGYFPTYTLGAIYAWQIFDAAEKAIPDLKGKIREGNFAVLREWLRENIHDVGSLYPLGDELITKLTGRPLDAKGFVAYLNSKYTKLYDLE